MAKQNSTYFSPTCFFCGKNNKRRHTRVGRHWTCTHCGEVNPGPAVMRSLVKQLGGHAESREPASGKPAPAAAQPAKVAVTKIRGAVASTSAPAKKPTKEPVAAATAASPAPAAAQPKPPSARPRDSSRSAPPPSQKKRGFLEGLVYG